MHQKLPDSLFVHEGAPAGLIRPGTVRVPRRPAASRSKVARERRTDRRRSVFARLRFGTAS